MVVLRAITNSIALLALVMMSCLADAQASPPVAVRQSLDNAWWTGPMLAPPANTLPRGHILLEPYLYDVSTQGFYNSSGTEVDLKHAVEAVAFTDGVLSVIAFDYDSYAACSLVKH